MLLTPCSTDTRKRALFSAAVSGEKGQRGIGEERRAYVGGQREACGP